jgi:hypothetical protein
MRDPRARMNGLTLMIGVTVLDAPPLRRAATA